MSPFTCSPMLAIDSLTATQHEDLVAGIKGIDAYWKAVFRIHRLASAHSLPINRCILGAMALNDILHLAGRKDAKVIRTGLEVCRTSLSDATSTSLIFGHPTTTDLPGFINGHWVVRLGDILLDPTHGQARDEWNMCPFAGAFLCGPKDGKFIFDDGSETEVIAEYHVNKADCTYRTTFFELTWGVRQQTRKWKKVPDAQPEVRKPLVQLASLYLENAPNNDNAPPRIPSFA